MSAKKLTKHDLVLEVLMYNSPGERGRKSLVRCHTSYRSIIVRPPGGEREHRCDDGPLLVIHQLRRGLSPQPQRVAGVTLVHPLNLGIARR